MGAQVGFDSAAPPAASPYRARRFTPVQNTYMPSVLFRIGSVLHVVALAGIASFNFPVLDHFTMTFLLRQGSGRTGRLADFP